MSSRAHDRARLQAIIDELRGIREGFEPKSNNNPRYYALSSAISQIKRAIEDMRSEEA